MPDKNLVNKVLSKPWAPDGYNFSERIWKDKNKLINTVHREISIDLITGRDPQKAINNIAKIMNTSKSNAGRLVMTEEAYFSSIARGECFEKLGVKKYKIVATLDEKTSEICQSMDLKVFQMSEFQAGVTAPPFHVRCRSSTAPYFENDYGVKGSRAARDLETGKTYYVPADMNYSEWKKTFVDGGDKSHLQETSKYGMKTWKRVDKSENSGIINTGSGNVALENQRYGRNKDTLVNKTYIESGEYKRKFDNVTDNPEVNKTLYDCAKKALKHRSGTVFEDMYWIDGTSGKVVFSVTDSQDERAVIYR